MLLCLGMVLTMLLAAFADGQAVTTSQEIGTAQIVPISADITSIAELTDEPPVWGTMFTDVDRKHWAVEIIERWALRGVLQGSDGLFRPNAPITRAEFAAVISRLMGYTVTTETQFYDVPHTAWYYGDIAKIYASGIMKGDGGGIMRPEANITREEATVMLARAFEIKENAGTENPFPDAGDISGWASLLVDGMKTGGYILGDNKGRFNPKAEITRAEVVKILNTLVTLYFDEPGEINCEILGEHGTNSVLINAPGVTIKNLRINGNLYITEGVGDGDVMLDNVTVRGAVYVKGGGENSVDMRYVDINEVVLDNPRHTAIVRNELPFPANNIFRFTIKKSYIIENDGASLIYHRENDTLSLGGTIDKVVLCETGVVVLRVANTLYDVGTPVGKVHKIELAEGSAIMGMETNAPVTIFGYGKIDKLTVRESGLEIADTVDVNLTDITVAYGVDRAKNI